MYRDAARLQNGIISHSLDIIVVPCRLGRSTGNSALPSLYKRIRPKTLKE
jgi:hypothetical protein